MVGYGVAAHAKGQIAKHAKESGVTDALKDKYDQKGKIIEDGGKFAKDSASYLYSGAKGGIAYASEGGGKGYAFALDGAKKTYEFLQKGWGEAAKNKHVKGAGVLAYKTAGGIYSFLGKGFKAGKKRESKHEEEKKEE